MPELVNVQDIPRQKVESSNVAEVGYDADSETLVVLFHNGGMYAYDGVPATTFDQMVGAESVGKFFNTNVKGKYDFRKVS
jgi:hypothetical protein